MQTADLTISNEMRALPVASSVPAVASDFFRLLGKVMRGDIKATQTLPPLTDDFDAPSSGSIVPETPADPSIGLWTEAVGEMVRHGSPQASDDGRDVTVSDQSGAALALAFLAGTVSIAAFERLAEGPCAVLTPASAEDVAFDPAAVSQFSETSEEATPLASVGTQADQHPLAAAPQGSVGHTSSLAVALSAADAISLTPARVIEEPPMGPGEEDSVRVVAPHGTPALSSSTPLTTGSDEGAAPSVVPDAPAELPRDQRLTPVGISTPALSKAEGPALGAVQGLEGRTSTVTEPPVRQPAIGRGEGVALSDSAPLTAGLAEAGPERGRRGPALSYVEGGRPPLRLSTERAGQPIMAPDEAADSGAGAAVITVSHDRPDVTAMEERPQPAIQLDALRGRLDGGQERPGSGSESGDGSRGMALPAPDSDRGQGSGLNFGEVASARTDALRSGAPAVAERDRSLTLQVTQQIMAATRLGRREDGISVRLRLRPESLGELLIKISWKEKGIVAGIQAESPVTARMLQEDLGHLKAALGERGIAVNDLGVQVSVDLRHGRAHDDRLPEATTSGVVREARPWRPRDETLPLANLIQREGMIDIRV